MRNVFAVGLCHVLKWSTGYALSLVVAYGRRPCSALRLLQMQLLSSIISLSAAWIAWSLLHGL